jgi:hypothetical protein
MCLQAGVNLQQTLVHSLTEFCFKPLQLTKTIDLRGYGPVKKTAHFERNQKPAETINPLLMQYTGECSIAEPSGPPNRLNAAYTTNLFIVKLSE